MRREAYERGKRAQFLMVCLMLSSIGQTLVLEEFSIVNPIITPDRNFALLLYYLLQSYKKQDPPILPSLAVPIELINHILGIK